MMTLEDFCKITEELTKESVQLRKEYDSLNLILTDINHLIEFSTLSASEGYKLCSELKVVLSRRRFVKNRISNLDKILDTSVRQVHSKNIKNPKEYKIRTVEGNILFKKYSKNIKCEEQVIKCFQEK